jgi:hypothetical protein
VAIPDNHRRSLTRRLDEHRATRWPNVTDLSVRFRGDFVYLTSTDITDDPMPLCRLTYRRNPDLWGFAIYLASRDTYENSLLPNGRNAATPEQALDCACGLYFNDPTAWLPDTPNNI